jgi:uncharacterized protein DUF1549/uncharacterized protein DUF1553
MRQRWFTLPILILASGLLLGAATTDCIFLKDPDQFTTDVKKLHKSRSDLTAKVSLYVSRAVFGDQVAVQTLDAAAIPRKNFIDDAIFGRMATANIRSAPLASDLEFLRRVTLDLTGRIPSGADVVRFMNDPNPSKRDLKVDALIGSPEFVDKWTMFLGDLYKNNSDNQNITRDVNGRDSFYLYLKESVSTNKPYDQLARELISASGDSFVQGQVNWPVGNTIAMGPVQDTYDGQAVNTASMFLGINVADCLLCHDGARHLDQVNLWGSKLKRQNMWGLSAYFARTRMQRQVVTKTPEVAKFIVGETATGEYQLNTTSGNRVARQPINGVAVIAPNYPFAAGSAGGVPTGATRRQVLAQQVTADIQFSRAIVNYIWEKFMVQAFVSPSNTFDLARLDPDNPPAAPWTLQPTNPQLLEALAEWFQANHYDLRALMSLIAKSNAYQLSSTYPGTWDLSYVPYYARRYVRRLDAEEAHDAITKATDIPAYYALSGALPPVRWAMQFPGTEEPASDGTVASFLNAFGRGDRDVNPRRSDGSILQSLDMLNSPVLLTRIHQKDQGSHVATLLSQTTDVPTIIRDLFLNTLSRPPSDQEIAVYTPWFQQSGTQVAAEDLQWVLLNKVDFLFNY